MNYKNTFRLPLSGDINSEFYTFSGLKIAHGFSRLVIGGRGPYIEFNDNHICLNNVFIPNDQMHRIGNDAFFYDEYRSNCKSNVKVYHQKNTVGYADYKVDKWYIDPFQLKTVEFESLFLISEEEHDILESIESEYKRNIWNVI